ncbi:MAG: substrate-binding domain-containing protein [Lachnospiraceae bacterium]|nr:substrate-binding domain-containing protein [Lachnospiraceae bacterium]
MKNMKKIWALLLAMTMMVSMLTGCGGQTEEPAAETVVTEEAEESTEEAVEEEPAVEESTEEAVVVDTVILKEADEKMLNTYSMIAVNPEAPFVDADGNAVADVAVNTAGADALIQWMLSEDALALAAEYGQAEYNDTLFYVLDDVVKYEGEIAAATEETKTVRLSTTTSVNDSGLLAALLPVFEEAYGYTVEVQSAGTGKAIAAAKNGNADLILVHSKSQEEAFVEEGFGRVLEGFEAERLSFIYNYFVLCGPSADPAGVAEAASVLDAFKAIADGKYTFISRGDASGTHTKELSLWPEEMGITAEAESFADYTEWYVSANTGMGACLVMAEEMGGYILTDKATFLTFVANDGVM